MINALKLWNFTSGVQPPEELTSRAFVLKTCQRTLVLSLQDKTIKSHTLSHQLYVGQDAYLFLLETICGLKSKLVGENEIVGQFKDAYKVYAVDMNRDNKLLAVLEKLFKDAKDIRTKYLIGISQKTYASLTRRHFISQAHADHIIVLGSGQLAEDLINQFKKKAKVSICARNLARASELARIHQIETIDWDKREELFKFPFIANTIGTDSILWNEDFFNKWSNLHERKLFVDLGSPSAIETPLSYEDGIVRLDDIFNEGVVVEGQKQTQIALARQEMLSISIRRKELFEKKFGAIHKLPTPQTTSGMRYL